MDDLKAIVTADISQLKAGMIDAQKSLAATAIAAGKLDSKLALVGKHTNSAGFALQNIGRVAQDAQFGFMGIANNLNPLLESFQRLRAESGSTGGALKALGGSIMGAGGIGLALSLAIPIIGFITTGFGAWTKGLKGNKVALDASAKAAKEAAEAYKSIVESIAQEATSISIIVEKLKTQNLSRKEQSAAIQELQRLAPSYFATLDKESATIAQITKAYDLYSASILRSIEARVRTKQLEDVTKRILELQDKGQKLTDDQVDASGKLVRSNISRMASQEDITEEINKGTNAYEEFQRVAQGTAALSITENRELTELLKTRAIILKNLAKEPLDLKIKGDGAEKAKKDIETISDVIAKMEAQIVVLNKKEIAFGTNESLNKIREIESTITELFTKFRLNTSDPIILNLKAEIADINLTEFSKRILKGDPKLKVDIPFEAQPIPQITSGGKTLLEEILRKQTLDSLKNLKVKYDVFGTLITDFTSLDTATKSLEPAMVRLNDLREAVAELTTSLAGSFGEAVAAFAQGGKGLGQVFEGVLSLMGDFLIQFGKAAVKESALVIAIKKLTIAPQIGLVAGLAAIVAGTLLKSFKMPKGFAYGGYVDGPGTSKSDSILARLSRKEYVINADAVAKFGVGFFDMLNKGFMPPRMNQGGSVGGGSIGGMQAIQVEGEFEMRGDRLVAVVKRAQNRISRNG